MKRTTVYSVLLLVVAILVGWHISQSQKSSITVLWYGVPQAGTVVTDIQDGGDRITDANGTIHRTGDPAKQQGTFVPRPDGGYTQIEFPKRGHRKVDLRGRYSTSELRTLKMGFLWDIRTSEQFDFTDQEMAQIESGLATVEEIKARIRAEAQP